MSRILLLLTCSLGLVVAIMVVAMAWVHISHTNSIEGKFLFVVRGSHGVHTFDIAMIGIEVVLFAILAGTLFLGFSRAR